MSTKRKIEKRVSDKGRTTYFEALEHQTEIFGRTVNIVNYKPIAGNAAHELIVNDGARLYDYSIREKSSALEIGMKFFVITNATTEKEGVTCTSMSKFWRWEQVVREMESAKDYPRNLGGRVEDADGFIIAEFDGEGNYKVRDLYAATKESFEKIEYWAYAREIAKRSGDEDKIKEANENFAEFEELILEAYRHDVEKGVSHALRDIEHHRDEGVYKAIEETEGNRTDETDSKIKVIDATKIEVTEDTEVKEIVYSIAYDDDMYQLNAETLAPYGGVKVVAGRVPVRLETVKVNAFITQVKGIKKDVDDFTENVIAQYSKYHEIHNIAAHGELDLDNFSANAKAIAVKYYFEHPEDPIFKMVDEVDEQSGLPVIKVRNALNEKISFFVKGHSGNLGLMKAIEMDISGDAILENNKYVVSVSDANCNLVVSETVDTPEEAIPILKKYVATNPSKMVVKSHYASQLRDEGFSYYLYDSRDKDAADKLSVLTGKATPVIEISKTDYANNLANAVANSPYARHRWDVYTIKNAANLKGFDDVRIAAQKVLDEGFDSFTVGDYINLTA